MNISHLWFIKYDYLILKDRINYQELRRIIRNRKTELNECEQTNFQIHLYDMLKFIDYFFNAENIVEIVEYRIESFTENQIKEIELKTTQLRILIEGEKIYCQTFWLNKKLSWDVEMRILASLCRMYIFVANIHNLVVGDSPNLWQKSKQKKLFIPLENWERFVNEIYSKLCKIEIFYYQYQYPYIVQIHQFIETFKQLLHNFPTLSVRDVIRKFQVFKVVLKENKKFINFFATKFRKSLNQNLVDIEGQNIQQKQLRRPLSLQYNKRKMFEINGVLNFIEKPKRQLSVKANYYNLISHEQHPLTKKIIYPIRIDKIPRRPKVSTVSQNKSSSEYASTRQITMFENTLNVREDTIVPGSVRESQSPSKGSDTRLMSRSKRVLKSSKKLIEKHENDVPINFEFDFVVQKQKDLPLIRKFHQSMQYLVHSTALKVNLGIQEDSPRKTKFQGVGSKLKIAERRIKQILEYDSEEDELPKLNLKTPSKKMVH